MYLSARKNGFTLIEVLAVLSIIVVILGLSVGLVSVVNLKTTESKAHKTVAILSAGIDKYRQQNGNYPDDDRRGAPLINGKPQKIGDEDKMPVPERPKRFIAQVSTTAVTYDADPWGNPWVYMTDDPNSQIDVASYTVGSLGRDQKPGVAGVDDDNDGKADNSMREFGYGDDITNKAR